MSDPDGGPAAAEPRRWQAPDIARGPVRPGAKPKSGLTTAGRVEDIQRQAYQEAFAQGISEGQAKGRAQVKAQVDRLEGIIRQLAAPLDRLDDRVVEEIVTLALAVARHIIRREISADPGQVMAAVREAAAMLPAAASRVRLFLHPEDAAVVRESMGGAAEQMGAWQIVEDPALTRGGCRLETEHARVDATVEKRLAAIAARMLGGERGQDDAGGD